jgi:hypothetical protein
VTPFCRNEPFTSNAHSSFKLTKAKVGEGLKTRSVTAAGDVVPSLPETGRPDDKWRDEAGTAGREAGDASVMMGNKTVSCLADQGWEGCASAWKVQAYSNSEAIGSSFIISSC